MLGIFSLENNNYMIYDMYSVYSTIPQYMCAVKLYNVHVYSRTALKNTCI